MLCDKGRSRLSNWCSFLKYDALTLQIFWTARCENREICEYLLFFKPKKKHEDRGTVCNFHLHSKLLHNINNAMCHCKQFNTILMLNSLVLIRKMSLCTLSIHKEQGQMLQFWVYLFLQFKNRGEDQLLRNRKAGKEDQVLCEIVLKLLQMLYALNILKTVLKAFIDCTEYSPFLFFISPITSFKFYFWFICTFILNCAQALSSLQVYL